MTIFYNNTCLRKIDNLVPRGKGLLPLSHPLKPRIYVCVVDDSSP